MVTPVMAKAPAPKQRKQKRKKEKAPVGPYQTTSTYAAPQQPMMEPELNDEEMVDQYGSEYDEEEENEDFGFD